MSFVEELWRSIFEPGASPVLVKATHISFAALVSVLIGLLVTTRSLHFVALLVLATGLWAGVTWFVGEVAKLQAEQRSNQPETLVGKNEKSKTSESTSAKLTERKKN